LKRTDDFYRAFTGTPSISSNNGVDLYSIKYIISVTPIEKDPRFELVYSKLEGLQGEREDLLKENTIKLYRNRHPLPRAWLVKDHRVLDEKSILAILSGKKFNPRKEVLLEEIPQWVTPNSLPRRPRSRPRAGQAGELSTLRSRATAEDGRTPNSIDGLSEIVSETNHRLLIHVRASQNAFLVLSDTYFPGWKVYVDGNKKKIYRANYAFRALPLEVGKHKVEFVYDPLSFKLGALISVFGLVLTGFLWIKYK
jgi:hypothetical protein